MIVLDSTFMIILLNIKFEASFNTTANLISSDNEFNAPHTIISHVTSGTPTEKRRNGHLRFENFGRE